MRRKRYLKKEKSRQYRRKIRNIRKKAYKKKCKNEIEIAGDI